MDVKKTCKETLEKVMSLGARKPKRIFIAATKQNVGKTTVSLGIVSVFKEHFERVGFIKPVGQRYLIENGFKVDEDAVLMQRIFNFGFAIKDMSPIAVEKGYTERFIDGAIAGDLSQEIRDSFSRISEQSDVVVIEGTGHAGVGSVFDLSNAQVANMLDAKVILVSSGGIGNPIDEVMLNKALFDKYNVKLAGVVVNKVKADKYEKIASYARRGLERLGVNVIGVLPYFDTLDAPTLQDIREELDMHVICGEQYLSRQMKKILVGAMEVKDAVQYFEDDCLMITPGDRLDLITLFMKMHTGRYKIKRHMTGIVLSGGINPPRRIFNMLREADIPTLVSRYNTYEVAARIHDLSVKIKSRDKNKVKLVVDMARQYIDFEQVLNALS
ncbi:MAG TPA: AAA family ATPase [Candidatus Omnitrophota bacterium]|nr:AAA family ATPase [Candidatus Omnitrophota bacterium]HPS19951.1 AAA family ATPase [Candidatus Omnitrophota bacterium]